MFTGYDDFNSSMVRLKGFAAGHLTYDVIYFNSSMVRLKEKQAWK